MVTHPPVAEAIEFVRWLGTTVPFFSVFPAFVGTIWLARFFVREFERKRPLLAQQGGSGRYRFDPDDFD